jgi:hypothetical protein
MKEKISSQVNPNEFFFIKQSCLSLENLVFIELSCMLLENLTSKATAIIHVAVHDRKKHCNIKMIFYNYTPPPPPPSKKKNP